MLCSRFRVGAMSVSYFKRFRMEFDLRGQRSLPIFVPTGYRLLPWQPDAGRPRGAKYHSFRQEIDADVFTVWPSSTAAIG